MNRVYVQNSAHIRWGKWMALGASTTLVLLMAILLAGCLADDDVYSDSAGSVLVPTWEFIQPNIFESSCASGSCHGGSFAPNLTSGEYKNLVPSTWIKPANKDNSSVYTRLLGTAGPLMPPSGKLPDEEINLIGEWIDLGAPEK